MPLIKGSSRDDISQNIRTEKMFGKKQPQAVAIALDVARRSKKADGGVADALKRANGGHVGPLRGPTPGRADDVSTSVEDGSYIIPAKTVSFLGDGNTEAGFAKLEKMFPDSAQHRAEGGIVGTPAIPHMTNIAGTPHVSPMPHLIGIPRPHLTGVPHLAGIPRISGVGSMPHVTKPHLARGGDAQKQVDVRLSHGEFTVSRKSCLKLGNGDLDRAHRGLDHFVVNCGKEAIKKEKTLPPPVGSKVKK